MQANSIPLLVAGLGLSASGLCVGCSDAPDATVRQEIDEPDDPASDASPPDFRLVGITGGGSGCSRRSAFDASWEGESGAIRFSEMTLSKDRGGGAFQTINCTVGFNLHVPAGWTFTLSHIQARGNVSIPAGAVGKEMSSYSFAGMPPSLSPHNEINGPREGSYVFTDGPGAGIEAPCGSDTILSVDSRLILDTSRSGDASASMSLERMSFHLQWRKCG